LTAAEKEEVERAAREELVRARKPNLPLRA